MGKRERERKTLIPCLIEKLKAKKNLKLLNDKKIILHLMKRNFSLKEEVEFLIY